MDKLDVAFSNWIASQDNGKIIFDGLTASGLEQGYAIKALKAAYIAGFAIAVKTATNSMSEMVRAEP